jgi:hypothetical protein
MSQNRIFDDLGRLMNEAAGVADGVRREIETVVRSQMERFVADMDLVKREDFDALRELVQRQSGEIADLKAQLDKQAIAKPAGKSGGLKTTARKSGKTSN